MPDRRIKINVNPQASFANLALSIQRVIDCVSFGLQCPVPSDVETLGRLPAATVQFKFGPDAERDPDALKKGFDTWILKNGFRELVEAVEMFLESIRSIAAVVTLAEIQQDVGQLLGRDVARLMEEEKEKFHQRGLLKRLKLLKDQHGLKADSKFEAQVASSYRARNCLVHRGGIVQPSDADASTRAMRVHWTRLAITAEGRSGSREVGIGSVGEKGDVFKIGYKPAQKDFHVGDPVQFSSQEFGEIAWTVALFGQSLTATLSKRVDKILNSQPDEGDLK